MEPVANSSQSDLKHVPKLAATSWVLYDVANTVYAATLTFLFTGYVQLKGGVFALGVTQTISMVLAGLTVPFLATLADRTGRAKTYLVISTLVCVGAMACFAIDLPLVGLMLAFATANFAYEYAMVFYNALLPSVAPVSRAGFISGLGVGLGYIGTLLALGVLLPVKDALGPEFAFALGAVFFLLLAMPCFLFVKETRVTTKELFTRALFKEQAGSLLATLRNLPKDRQVFWFLLGNFFCVDVVNTAILFFAVYSTTVYSGQMFDLFGMTVDLRPHVEFGVAGLLIPNDTSFLMLIGVTLNVFALGFGIGLGVLADRWKAIRTMRLAAIALLIALCGAAFITGESFSSAQIERINSIAAGKTEWEQVASDMDAQLVSPNPEFVTEQKQRATERTSTARTSFSLDPIPIPNAALEKPAGDSLYPLLYVIFVTIFGAAGLAGIWTAGRKVLMEIAPRERLGEYFGLYGITLKLSVIGALVFTWLLHDAGAVWAMGSQAVMLVVGLLLLAKVRAK